MPNPPPRSKLLLIDDDPGLLRLMQKALQNEEFDVATARSGSEAHARLAEGPFMLLVVDLRLEDMSGQELLAQFSEKRISIPFVVITGQGDERVAVEMMKRGALDYLVKDAEFVETI